MSKLTRLSVYAAGLIAIANAGFASTVTYEYTSTYTSSWNSHTAEPYYPDPPGTGNFSATFTVEEKLPASSSLSIEPCRAFGLISGRDSGYCAELSGTDTVFSMADYSWRVTWISGEKLAPKFDESSFKFETDHLGQITEWSFYAFVNSGADYWVYRSASSGYATLSEGAGDIYYEKIEYCRASCKKKLSSGIGHGGAIDIATTGVSTEGVQGTWRTIPAIPLPATAPLLVGALGVIALQRRRCAA